jgi:DNA-binding MarR family transcriptional regulator
MNLDEVLKLTDDLIFAKTGKYLDNLQKMILRGTWNNEYYREIAENVHRSEDRVREVGMELWQLLSQELGEDINKSNFRSVMERITNNYSIVFKHNNQENNNFNICGRDQHHPNISNPNSQTPETSHPIKHKIYHEELSEKPELGTFYDRTSDRDSLTTLILQEKCRLISLTGISGIGKTTLAVKLVEDIKHNFEYVIWCNLENYPTFTEFQSHLIDFFSQSENQELSKPLPLIKYLQKYHCLILLDNLQNLFITQELAGKYKPETEEYRSFFKQIETLAHLSCFLLIGWEQLREIPQVKNPNSPFCNLQLTGLDSTSAEQILRDYGLGEIDKYSTLINRYQGHPLYLKSVANLMQELEISITDLLLNDPILLTTEIKDILQQQCDRLSNLEKQIITLLAKENQAINLVKLLEKSLISPEDLTNTLQSLCRRCLVEKQQSCYHISLVLKAYINGYRVD